MHITQHEFAEIPSDLDPDDTLRDRMDQPGSDLAVALPILRVTDC
jgi:hypothetical protein